MIQHMISTTLFLVLATTVSLNLEAADPKPFPFFEYLTGAPTPTMIAYTPSGLDPRHEPNNELHPTQSFRADLEALRPSFDGLVLYGYHPASTPRIMAIAKELKFRAVLLGIWQPKSAVEIDGVAQLVQQFQNDFALGVLVGNEGIIFKRYETDDLTFAAARIRTKIPSNVPISTSEPLIGYESEFICNYGDFLAPNIHPAFDRPDLEAAEAATWARQEAVTLSKRTGKSLLLKETGFPHDGKDIYTVQTQAEFWSSYLAPGVLINSRDRAAPWIYFGVGFEAFDLPWKSEASQLPIEKAWGLFSTERKPYPAMEAWRKAAGRASK